MTGIKPSVVIHSILTVAFSGLLLASSCESPQQPQSRPARALPTTSMKIGSRTCELEIARTSDEQELGLMKRNSMPANHGMIFVFSNEEVRYFWMKNTRFDLDILFLDSDGKVVSISRMKAYDLNTTSSEFPARYAIELNAGAAKEAAVKAGDVLEIPTAAKARK